MRVIINLHSHHIAKFAGWRARAIQINTNNESTLDETLKAVVFENKRTMFDIIIEKQRLKNEFVLFLNGSRVPDNPDFKIKIKDNVQIHLLDKPGK
jgi:hypothetical protein